jgi:tripeptide aminopeptidase
MSDDRILDTFLDLARIESVSLRERGVAEYIMRAARENGFDAYMDKAGEALGGNAGNVYVKIPGFQIEAPPLMFCSHMDVVTPVEGVEPVVKGERVVSASKTILGADCKAGITAMIELMRMSAQGEVEHGPLELLFTIAEEQQLQGSRHIERKRIESKNAVVLDGEGAVGKIINASPTQDNLDFIFKGKAAHSGVEPEKGVNAILGASWAISLMHLGRIDSDTTANIGVINGGRAVNIVPEMVLVKGEVRSLKPDKLEQQRKAMVKAALEAEAAVGVGVEVKVERAYEAFHIDPKDPLVQLAVEGGRAMGLKMEIESSGGGSDANYFNTVGIKSVVLSIGAREPHTVHENVKVKDLHKLARLCGEIANSAGRMRIRS